MSADAAYDAELHHSAEGELEDVPHEERELLTDRVIEAAGYKDPTDAPKVKHLNGDYADGLFRVRGGKWRAICCLEKPRLVVLLVEKRKRSYDDHKIEAAQRRRYA